MPVLDVPYQAMTVGPQETWKAECVSIWHPGFHDNALGIRLTAYMISKKIVDTSVPMSLLAEHPNVRFSYLRPGIGSHFTLRAEVLRLGSRVASTRMEFMGPDGKLMSSAAAAYIVS